MKEYHLISIGTGSAIHIVDAMLQRNPNLKVAVIDKDEPGGICLTRGLILLCIFLAKTSWAKIAADWKKEGKEWRPQGRTGQGGRHSL